MHILIMHILYLHIHAYTIHAYTILTNIPIIFMEIMENRVTRTLMFTGDRHAAEMKNRECICMGICTFYEHSIETIFKSMLFVSKKRVNYLSRIYIENIWKSSFHKQVILRVWGQKVSKRKSYIAVSIKHLMDKTKSLFWYLCHFVIFMVLISFIKF